MVAQTVSIGGNPPAASAAAVALNAAADRLGSSDDLVGPGQYRHIVTHSWSLVQASGLDEPITYLQENQVQIWAPHTWTDQWLMRSEQTGRRKWIQGSEADARKDGLLTGPTGPEVLRARCGDFLRDPGQRECTQAGGWQDPTPDWMAGLPRNPKKLFDRLRRDAPSNSRGDTELLVYAAHALRSGLLPADLRTALYRALALLPDLQIIDRAANLDGRIGLAYGMDDGITRHDIIIDERTGQFIGEREVVTHDGVDLPNGTVLNYTSVTTTVVDHLGSR